MPATIVIFHGEGNEIATHTAFPDLDENPGLAADRSPP
jgi:hypothetical protein